MSDPPTFGALNYTILGVYLAVMFGIGLWFSRRQATTEDFFLAGRRMPWLVVAMSMFASLTSAISYMGIPGTAYKENIALLGLAFMSPLAAPFIILIFYPFYRRLQVTTSYEYLERRYDPRARFVVSGLFLAARLGWLGTVIYAPALALSVVTGVDLTLAILLMGLLATAYTALGGLSAVLWTDVIQFIVLVGGAIWVAIALVTSIPGGVSTIYETAAQTDHLHVLDWKVSLYEMTGVVVAVSYFLQFMQDYGTDQVTVQRMLAVKTFRGMAKAALLNSAFDLVIVPLLLFVGLGLFAYFHIFSDRLADGIASDRVLPYFIMHGLPNGVSGLLITAIFAAAMSSMDSGINSLSTVIVNDFVKPLRRAAKSEKSDVRLARILTVALGSFATGVAFYASTIEGILKASSLFLGLFSGPILAAFLLGILTRRANFPGWVAGTLVAIPCTLWLRYGPEVHFVYYFPSCFGISFVIGYLASRLIGRSEAERRLTLWGRSDLGTLDPRDARSGDRPHPEGR